MEKLDELFFVDAGESVHFSFQAWKQREMEVRLKCLECFHLGKAHKIVANCSGRFDLNEDCFFCGVPMLSEVLFA